MTTTKDSTVELILAHKKPTEDREIISGIYFLILNDEIIYVGRSKDVHSRISSHENSDKNFNFYSIIRYEALDELDWYEPYYIELLRPRLNKSLPNTGEFISFPQAKATYLVGARKIRSSIPDERTITFKGMVYYRKSDLFNLVTEAKND